MKRRSFIKGLLGLPLIASTVKVKGAPTESCDEQLNVVNPVPNYRYYWARSDRIEYLKEKGWEPVETYYKPCEDLVLIQTSEENYQKHQRCVLRLLRW